MVPPPPSTTRKKLRVPRISKGFETPITRADDCWNVSDTSIDLGGPSTTEAPEEVDEDDFSESEYMPPTAIGETNWPNYVLHIIHYVD